MGVTPLRFAISLVAWFLVGLTLLVMFTFVYRSERGRGVG
jgi:hypothetical protein